MSATSSDAESSCGWTIISNEGSDIETLGSEAAAVEYGAELLEHPSVGDTKLQDTQASASTAGHVEEGASVSLDDTLVEQTIDETLYESEDAHDTTEVGLVTLLSSSDHSDIVTLNSKEHVQACEEEVEGTSGEELYLGTPCSSQYTFTATDTGKQPESTTSSSSEDEEGRSSTTAVRRRRLRKNTTSIETEPEDEELDLSQHEEEEDDDEDAEQLEMQRKGSSLDLQNVKEHSSSILNKCIMVALIIAISMGFGHFHGTVQIQERQKPAEKIRLNELDGVRDLLQQHVGEQVLTDWMQTLTLDDLNEQVVLSLLTDIVDKLQKENQKLRIKQAQIQAQRDITIRELEAMEAGTDTLLSENQKLKDQLEEEKQLVQNFQNQNQDMMAEAQKLRMKINQEKAATDELQTELNHLRSHIASDKQSMSEAEELQFRVKELENRLHFEQQRSDLWERLYLETKEERAKGDTEPKVKKQRSGVSQKVKETFDAVKSATKKFVYYHKEQIKKAKEAMKENIRKFSCSGVLHCAYQESMSLFNEATEPIKADEFHQLLRSYLQQKARTGHHWKDLEVFIKSLFNNRVFIHNLMPFKNFVSDVGVYLTEIHKDQGFDGDVFRRFVDLVYRHFFGEAYMKTYHPNGLFQGP